MTRFLLAVFLCAAAGHVSAKEMIFYKYADGGGGYSVLIASSESDSSDISTRNVIAKKMAGAAFELKNVPADYYNVAKTDGIAFFGEKIVQYKITPLVKDRFSHTVWVDEKGNLLKTEIYDTEDKLLFAFSSVDFDPVTSARKKPSSSCAAGVKKPFYKGFCHIYTNRLPDGVTHLMFTDGLNRFSVFINPRSTDTGTVSKVVYGNYLLSRVVSGTEYTVIGSVPYSTMEEVIKVLNGAKSEINDVLKTGSLLTDEIYVRNIKMEELPR